MAETSDVVVSNIGTNRPYSTSEAAKAVASMKVVPTERHGAAVEWHVNGYDIEVEFDARGIFCGVSIEQVGR